MKKKKRKVNKNTKAYKEKQIKKASNKCLKLWKECIKVQADYMCEAPDCHETKQLNSHHIESYDLNPYLRHSICNGLCLCAKKHHKFTKYGVHKSGLFILKMQEIFPERFEELTKLSTAIESCKNLAVRDLRYYEVIEQSLLGFLMSDQLNG
ncbi:hypothetical protein ACFLQL_00665 [Verrucomicrobiota bacterium]